MKRVDIDWEAIEREYRAGIKSIRRIGKEFGLTHRSVGQRAACEGWERNLAEKIRQAAKNKLAAEVSKPVSAQIPKSVSGRLSRPMRPSRSRSFVSTASTFSGLESGSRRSSEIWNASLAIATYLIAWPNSLRLKTRTIDASKPSCGLSASTRARLHSNP